MNESRAIDKQQCRACTGWGARRMLKGPCRVCEDGAGGRAEPGGAAAAQGLSGSLRTQPCRLPRQAVYYWRKVTGLLAPRVPPSAGCGDGSRSALTCAAVTVNPRQPSPCRAHRAQGSSAAQLSLGTPAGSLTCYLLPLAFRFYFFFFSFCYFFHPSPWCASALHWVIVVPMAVGSLRCLAHLSPHRWCRCHLSRSTRKALTMHKSAEWMFSFIHLLLLFDFL